MLSQLKFELHTGEDTPPGASSARLVYLSSLRFPMMDNNRERDIMRQRSLPQRDWNELDSCCLCPAPMTCEVHSSAG